MPIAAKRSLAWAMALTAVAGVALAVMLWTRAERDLDAEMAEAPSENAPPARNPGNGTVPPSAAATTSVAVAEPAPELDHDTLWRLCPSLWGELSDDCMAALEARYADRAAGLRDFDIPPLPLSTSITWRQVYADPAATRRIVADALRNPECRVPEGQVRPDLGEVCAADAMTRFAILQQQCGLILLKKGSGASRQRIWESVSSSIENDKSLDFDEYHRHRTNIDEDEFRGTWHVRKCRAAEPVVRAWLPEFPVPQEGPESRTYYEGSMLVISHEMRTYDQGKHLIPAAARLGSEWALARTLDSAAHINAMAEFDLALAYAGRARKVGSESDHYPSYIMVAGFYAHLRGVSLHEFRLPRPKVEFTEEQLQAAKEEVRRIVERGWEPMVDG